MEDSIFFYKGFTITPIFGIFAIWKYLETYLVMKNYLE